jgi:RNA polymerase sigma factor (sigma-70 family)
MDCLMFTISSKMNEDLMYVERVKRGDTASYRFLVEKYQHMAYTLALNILKNSGDAEDAAQEGFVKAYQNLHKYEGKAKFSTWLYTVLYRCALDKIPSRHYQEIQDHHQEPVHNYAETNILQEERENLVRRAVQSLPQTESLLITLFYMENCSIKEIQDITQLSESNIKVKLFRAKKTLHERLKFLKV